MRTINGVEDDEGTLTHPDLPQSPEKAPAKATANGAYSPVAPVIDTRPEFPRRGEKVNTFLIY